MWGILTLVTGGGSPNTYQVGYYEATVWFPELESNSAVPVEYTTLSAAANRTNFLNGGDGYGRFQVTI
tara:strand:- start:9395 stop:9598 length:204 start_codon:yes stop_codon:yes gene_type:complete